MSIVTSLYLFEAYLIFKSQPLKEQISKEKIYEKQTGKKWDKRSKFEIYDDLKKIYNQIVFTVEPEDFLNENLSIFPLSGISNSKTIFCNENGYYAIYKSDRFGFNNPDTEWDKNEVEFFIVGDSFVHGACVNRPNDISSVLRSITNKSVLNLGFSGNGPMINYATLREYINSNVKKVLWVYYEGNDLRNLENEKKNNILKKYLSNKNFSQNIKFRQDEINNIANSFILEKAREKERNLELEKERKRNLELWKERKRNLKLETNIFKLIKFIKIFHTRNLISSIIISSPSKTMPAEFKKTLQLTKEIVEKNNSKLYFIYLPEYSRNITIYDNTNYNFIKKMVVELEIPFIDIQKLVFEKEKNALSLFPFELKGHYNVLGYRKVAEMIYKFTKD